jgi:hypothetical protein
MKENSELAWDPEREIPTCDDAVWNEYVKDHEDAVDFRTQPFLWYHDMEEILTGITLEAWFLHLICWGQTRYILRGLVRAPHNIIDQNT